MGQSQKTNSQTDARRTLETLNIDLSLQGVWKYCIQRGNSIPTTALREGGIISRIGSMILAALLFESAPMLSNQDLMKATGPQD